MSAAGEWKKKENQEFLMQNVEQLGWVFLFLQLLPHISYECSQVNPITLCRVSYCFIICYVIIKWYAFERTCYIDLSYSVY